MGIYNSKPIMEMSKTEGETLKISYCSCSVQGWRKGQEDAFSTIPNLDGNCSFFGVFDGHGGPEVSKFAAQNYSEFLTKNEHFKKANYKQALEETFLEFDRFLRTDQAIEELLKLKEPAKAEEIEEEDDDVIDEEDLDKLLQEASIPLEQLINDYQMSRVQEKDSVGLNLEKMLEGDSEDDEEVDFAKLEEEGSEESEEEEDSEESEADESEVVSEGLGWSDVAFDCGTTAVVTLVVEGRLIVANVGDSRAVLCRAGKCVPLSEDHKPEDERETERITKAGSVVSFGRVDNGLNLSRALGDWRYKESEGLSLEEQAITSVPGVVEMPLEEGDEFMLMGTDGIWNSMTSEETVAYVRSQLKGEDSLSDICEGLFNQILSEDTSGDGTGCDNMTCTIVLFKGRDFFTRTNGEAHNSAKRARVE